jgi:hypothetical protein
MRKDQIAIIAIIVAIIVAVTLLFTLSSTNPTDDTTSSEDPKQETNPEPEPETPEPPVSEPTEFALSLAEEANARWGHSRVYPATKESATEGWWRASLTVPDRAELSNLCYIFMKGDSTRNLSDNVYFLEGGPVDFDGGEKCKLSAIGGPITACGNLTFYIDLEGMKTGYDAANDNWQDFFTCLPAFDSEFCDAECRTLMEALMSQERHKIVITKG